MTTSEKSINFGHRRNIIRDGEKAVRCNQNHSGNYSLTFDVGYFQCAGCANSFTLESVERALDGPVEQRDNSGGVYRAA